MKDIDIATWGRGTLLAPLPQRKERNANGRN